MARGYFGGLLAGGVFCLTGLSGLSLLMEQPAGSRPPAPPQVEAPQVDGAPVQIEQSAAEPTVSSPVGSLEIVAPEAPELPEAEQSTPEPEAPADPEPEAAAPRADTDPLDEPQVIAIEGAMSAPATPTGTDISALPLGPVLPSPQASAPQTPTAETNVTVSTTPAAPTMVLEPEPTPQSQEGADTIVQDQPASEGGEFVVDLDADNAIPPAAEDALAARDTPSVDAPATTPAPAPGLQLQGGENSLLADRDTGVVIRRPSAEAPATSDVQTTTNALEAFAADAGDTQGRP